MKRFLIGLCVLGLVLAGTAPAFAGGTINKSNLSIEYFRILSRNAATDHADIVAYNPAGTVKMDDGLYANLSVQYLIEKNYQNNFTDRALGINEHETTEPSAIPGLYSIYKKGPWAAFFGVNVPLGGGKVDYEQGNLVTYQVGTLWSALNSAPPASLWTLQSHQIDAESYGIGYTLGGAYQINDMFSVSLGLRYIDAKVDMSGSATRRDAISGAQTTDVIAFEADATGLGGIVGFDIYPNDKMTIGLRYETRTELEYEYEVSQGPTILSNLANINNGDEKRDDLPATFGAGFSYQLTDRFRTEVNFTYYFNTGADIGGTTLRNNPEGDSRGLEDLIDNGWEIGLGGEYALTKNFKLSAGYLFTESGVNNPKYSSKFLPDLDSHTIGFGCQWTVIKDLDLNFGAGNVFYVSDSYVDNTLGTAVPAGSPWHQPNMTVEFDKNIPYVGFGIQYKFF